MKKKLVHIILLFTATLFLAGLTPGCKSKVSDTEVTTSVEKSIRENPDLSGVTVSVVEGVATLTGEVKDEAAKLAAATKATAIKGVKSVDNRITVAMPVEVTADDPLRTSVADAIKDHPGVVADVNDGVITLTGQISAADRVVLLQKINALKPKRIENKLTVK